jgi:proline racemase
VRLKNVMNIVTCHAEGAIGHVMTGGIGDVPGDTMFDKKQYFEKNLDHLRKLVLLEPRGAITHSVNIVLPSNHPDALLGYLIAEATQLPEMSGSNTICVATVLLETGMVEMTEPQTELVLESAAGLIRLTCTCQDGKVTGVTIVNQPAFVYEQDAIIEVPGIGPLRTDVAWGGMAYAIVDAADVGLRLTPDEDEQICRLGQAIKAAAAEQLTAVHPENPEFAGITQTEFTGPLREVDGVLRSRNAVVVSPGYIDRSPCGTGTSARLALMHARGEIEPGQRFVHESVIGTTFRSRVEELTTVGPYPAVVPSFTGQAWITGMSQVGLDPSDPFFEGFTLAALASGECRTALADR